MRDMRTGICALCDHPEVIAAAAHDYYNSSNTTAIAVTRVPPAFIGRPKVMGAMAMYVCRACGYTQWFATEPGEIPVGTEHGTMLVPHS